MEEKEALNKNIPAEKFAFVNADTNIHDQAFDTKPVGYFKDAMRRFRKNRGSVIAGIIILLLVLFAIFVPIFSSPVAQTERVSYYAKMAPRTTWGYNIGINGSTNKDYNENLLMKNLAIGVGAEYSYNQETGEEHIPTTEEGRNSYYQPVVSINGYNDVIQGGDKSRIYHANVDTYLGVGFIYVELQPQAYKNLVNFENESGIKVIYPMIDTNSEYCFSATDANFWYKASKNNQTRGAPLDANDKIQHLSSDTLTFNDVYLRKDGVVQYYVRAGGGDEQTASYKCRVLYYNYYRYLYNCEPNYVFGTDSQGYDLAYRMSTGMRLSFILSVLVSIINFVIGAIYGAVEGYYGGATDLIMERISDILVGVPFIVVSTLFQLHLAAKVGAFPSLIFAFVLTGWIGTASRVRSQFYRFKNNEYVLAARTLGASDRRIMWKHIFPNTLGTIITSSVLVIPGVIFSESMLSYLGIVNLGSATSTSLGTLISEAAGIWMSYPHLMVFPAVVISLLMICFNLFGNGLRDAFNPTLRGAEE